MDLEQIRKLSFEVLSQVDWSLTSEKIIELTDEIITEGRKEFDEIVSLPMDKQNFETVILQTDKIWSKLFGKSSSCTFPSYMSTDLEVRKSATQSRQSFELFSIETGMRADLYKVVKHAAENPGYKLDEIERRLVQRLLRNFKRNGLDLDESLQDKIKSLNEKISKNRIKFSQTLNEITDTLIVSENELSGVPKSVLDNLRRTDDNNYIVGMAYPEIVPVLEYADNPETRSKAIELYGNRGVNTGNSQLLEDTIALKHEKANLLGYENHAEFMLEVKMAKNAANVWNFLEDTTSKLHDFGNKELIELKELKLKRENSDTVFGLKDWPFYIREYQEIRYNVDHELIKQYFSMKKTLNVMMQFYQSLLSLDFHLIDDAPSWHKDVQVYAVLDNETQEFIGIFYLDLYPREGKYSHAAVFAIIKSRRNELGNREIPIAAMECNFNKPGDGIPSLLKHSEVETLYHEFGHVMHQLCTKSRYFTFSGTSVSKDFSEAPSQMLENWIWEPSVLKNITEHYQTGKPMPDDIIKNLVDTKYALSALLNLRQLFFSTFDMTIHTTESVDCTKLWHELSEKISLVSAHPNTSPQASFGHFMSSYDAGYYGYLWSKVIAQDLYTRFENEGIESTKVGKDYRKYILEPGNDKDESDLIKDFLGREPNNTAFLRSLGLK